MEEYSNLVYCVDDDIAIRELYGCAFALGGFLYRALASGKELFAELNKRKPDLIVLDLMLPGEDGFDILKSLKSDTRYVDIPVIIVSAKSGESDKVKGLDMGADDYMDKPFKVMEFLARVKANIRKTQPANIPFKGLKYDVNKKIFFLNGAVMKLTNKETQLLKLLLENREKLIEKEALIAAVWPDAIDIETRTVDVHLSMLRKKLAPAGIELKTVRGVGYILE